MAEPYVYYVDKVGEVVCRGCTEAGQVVAMQYNWGSRGIYCTVCGEDIPWVYRPEDGEG